MDNTELINDNFFTVLMKYDFIIVPVTCLIFFFISGRKFNGINRLIYFLALVCIVASIIHLIYIYTYVSDTTDSTVTYTNVMYVILTLELSSFILYGIFLLIGLLFIYKK